ncbi:hypothetical protein DPEC_G00126570 [Dallia pectoralis]|uniref:Uncharacterized protein n=1 Tax=Dallia pectoralis TaxID=75939 RepID=A0ACC2GRK3_DALPE|nr:hypothetical protein DPEC_G00126570 [Dallia pectoralis]
MQVKRYIDSQDWLTNKIPPKDVVSSWKPAEQTMEALDSPAILKLKWDLDIRRRQSAPGGHRSTSTDFGVELDSNGKLKRLTGRPHTRAGCPARARRHQARTIMGQVRVKFRANRCLGWGKTATEKSVSSPVRNALQGPVSVIISCPNIIPPRWE